MRCDLPLIVEISATMMLRVFAIIPFLLLPFSPRGATPYPYAHDRARAYFLTQVISPSRDAFIIADKLRNIRLDINQTIQTLFCASHQD